MSAKVPIVENAIYSCREVANIIGVGENVVRKLIKTGCLKANKVEKTRQIFIKGSSILEMLDNKKSTE